jgi:hypothetical protein
MSSLKNKYFKYKSKYLQLKNQFGGTKVIITYDDKSFEVDAPDNYVNKIGTFKLFKNPVNTADGRTYEKEYIEEWFKKNNTSPATGAELPNKNLILNSQLKKAIDEFIKRKIEKHKKNSKSTDKTMLFTSESLSEVSKETNIRSEILVQQYEFIDPSSENISSIREFTSEESEVFSCYDLDAIFVITNSYNRIKIILDPRGNLLLCIGSYFYIISYKEKSIIKSFRLNNITRVGGLYFDKKINQLIISNGKKIKNDNGHFIMTINYPDYLDDCYSIVQLLIDQKKKDFTDYRPKNIYYPTGIVLHKGLLYVNCAVKYNSIKVFRYSTGKLEKEFKYGITTGGTTGGKMLICADKIIVRDNKTIYVLNIADGTMYINKNFDDKIIDFDIDENIIILILDNNIIIKLSLELIEIFKKSFEKSIGDITNIVVVEKNIYLVCTFKHPESFVSLLKF